MKINTAVGDKIQTSFKYFLKPICLYSVHNLLTLISIKVTENREIIFYRKGVEQLLLLSLYF